MGHAPGLFIAVPEIDHEPQRQNGALCPPLNLTPGAYVDIIGGAPGRVRVWEPATSPISRARGPSWFLLHPVEAAMTPRIQKNLHQPPSPEPLHVTHRHAAGIDIHAGVHWVAVPPGDAPPPPADHSPNLPAHVRRF